MKVSTSERLKELSLKLDIKQSDMCLRTGIPKSTMSLYWSGQRVPKQNVLTQIADAYNIQEAWLLGYDVPMSRQAQNKNVPTMEFVPELMELIENYNNMTDEHKKLLLDYSRVVVNNYKGGM